MRLLPVNGEGQKQNFLPGVAVSARAVTPPSCRRGSAGPSGSRKISCVGGAEGPTPPAPWLAADHRPASVRPRWAPAPALWLLCSHEAVRCLTAVL